MNFSDLISLCIKNLLRRRTRTFLAIFGVVIGTCAIVVMLSVGFGMTASYDAQIENQSGIHMITLYGNGGGNTMTGSQPQAGVLTDKTLAQIEQKEGVTAVTPVVSVYMTIGVGKYVAQTEILGVKPEVLEKFNYKLAEGRMLTSADKDAILFGSWVPQWFMNPRSSNWESVAVDVITNKMVLTQDWYYGQKENDRPNDAVDYKIFDVVGIGLLEETNDDSDYRAYMNIDRLEEIKKENAKAEGQRNTAQLPGEKTYNQAMVYIEDLNYVEQINKELKEEGYQAYSPINWLSQMKETANMIQMILGGIGGISLLVAALSITNTMVMSIYERTREIGVMKVIGANLRDIRRMFLIEAGMIGFIGGVIGVGVSLLLSLLMNTVLYDIISIALSQIGGGFGYGAETVISVIPLWTVFAAVAFSTLIGVIAGYSPASRAMKLSALESLKNE